MTGVYSGILRKSRQRDGLDSWKVIRSVKVRITIAQISRAEKDLLRGIENEGAVEAALFAEVELLLKPRERNACHRLPRILFLCRLGDDFWDGSRLTGSILPCLGEEAGPPSTIGGEIDFEVAGAVRSCDEEFGNVILPEFGLILRGLALGV